MAPIADVDVLIIGAGMAGITAARELQKSGREVVVLEARNRPGGRIHTVHVDGAGLDLGAAWIHGAKTNPLSDMAAKAGITTFRDDDDLVQIFAADGGMVADQAVDDAEAKFNRLLKKAAQLAEEREEDMSLREAVLAAEPSGLDDALGRFMLHTYTAFDLGAAPDRLSAWYFDDDEEFKGKDVLLLEGYSRLIEDMARDLDIRYETVVERIEYGDDGVEVFTNRGSFESYQAVVTLPLGVLRDGDITFDPRLPKKKRKAIESAGFGAVNKAVLHFDQAFWPLESHYFGLLDREDGAFPYWLNTHPFTGRPILVGIALNEYATDTMPGKDDAAVIDDALGALGQAFGDAVTAPREAVITRWNEEPFSRGAYSFAAVGARGKVFRKLAEPVEDVLFFAGEHTQPRLQRHRAWRLFVGNPGGGRNQGPELGFKGPRIRSRGPNQPFDPA